VATHKSAEKRARQDARRQQRNQTVRARTRTVVKKLRAALDAGSSEVGSQLRETERALRKAASQGIIPKRRASRLVSRLARRAHRAGKA
jgi:small subunit ribosomal protein S20